MEEAGVDWVVVGSAPAFTLTELMFSVRLPPAMASSVVLLMLEVLGADDVELKLSSVSAMTDPDLKPLTIRARNP